MYGLGISFIGDLYGFVLGTWLGVYLVCSLLGCIGEDYGGIFQGWGFLLVGLLKLQTFEVVLFMSNCSLSPSLGSWWIFMITTYRRVMPCKDNCGETIHTPSQLPLNLETPPNPSADSTRPLFQPKEAVVPSGFRKGRTEHPGVSCLSRPEEHEGERFLLKQYTALEVLYLFIETICMKFSGNSILSMAAVEAFTGEPKEETGEIMI